MDDLKNVFGTEALTFEQFTEKLGTSKDVKLANLAGGGYVGIDKHKTLETERDTLKGQLDTANTQLKGYDPEWQTKAQAAADAAQQQIEAVKFDFALDGALRASKAKNPATVKALINKDALKMAGDEIVGLKEQLEKVKTENDFLFDTDQPAPPPPSFSVPGSPAPPKPTDKAYLDDFYKTNPFYKK